jgi:hypothetical protein
MHSKVLPPNQYDMRKWLQKLLVYAHLTMLTLYSLAKRRAVHQGPRVVEPAVLYNRPLCMFCSLMTFLGCASGYMCEKNECISQGMYSFPYENLIHHLGRYSIKRQGCPF